MRNCKVVGYLEELHEELSEEDLEMMEENGVEIY